MSPPTDTWFTGPRLERLAGALLSIGTNAPGITKESAVRTIWRKCGGSHEEVRQVLEILAWLNLVRIDGEFIRRANAGNPVARSLRSGDYRPFGLTIIRAGLFSEQARSLLESGNFDPDGNLVCLPRVAVSVAPQLVGLLSWWPGFQSRPKVVVPSSVVSELAAVWALRAPEEGESSWLSQRRRVGNRAELYSFQRERSQAQDPSAIAWVAKDSDSLGWDIEDRTATPYRRIEVKGSRGESPVFYLSENEWKQASIHGSNYEVQFWGNIDLQREEPSEYASLRTIGFPIVLTNICEKVASGEWTATPAQWRIAKNEMSEQAKQ